MASIFSSATALRARLAARELSAVEALDAVMAQADRVNPSLNAIVARNDDAARKAAAESDARFANGTARPLEGLPITIKDAWEVAGLVSTGGVPDLAGFVPDEDAVPVARLRAAGAVIFGKTNVPLLSADFQSTNAVYGTSNNPWGVTRTPGGSSGGAAAAVASGMSTFELGSDIGGSIRWPAHANGLFGLKTTWDMVPDYGHVPPLRAARTRKPTALNVTGPLARSAADLDLILSVIAGPLDQPSTTLLKAPRATSAKGVRLALWSDPFAPVDQSVSNAIDIVAAALAADGAQIDRAARPDVAMSEIFTVYSLLLHSIMLEGYPERIRMRMAAEARNLAPDDISHRALQIRAATLDGNGRKDVLARRAAIKARFAEFFSRYDGILAPVAAVPAIPHDHNPDVHARRIITEHGVRPYFDLLHWAAPATVAHLPAAVAPAGRDPQGLPIGVQIICAEEEDRTAIAIAGMIERAHGGFVAPPV